MKRWPPELFFSSRLRAAALKSATANETPARSATRSLQTPDSVPARHSSAPGSVQAEKSQPASGTAVSVTELSAGRVNEKVRPGPAETVTPGLGPMATATEPPARTKTVRLPSTTASKVARMAMKMNSPGPCPKRSRDIRQTGASAAPSHAGGSDVNEVQRSKLQPGSGLALSSGAAPAGKASTPLAATVVVEPLPCVTSTEPPGPAKTVTEVTAAAGAAAQATAAAQARRAIRPASDRAEPRRGPPPHARRPSAGTAGIPLMLIRVVLIVATSGSGAAAGLRNAGQAGRRQSDIVHTLTPSGGFPQPPQGRRVFPRPRTGRIPHGEGLAGAAMQPEPLPARRRTRGRRRATGRNARATPGRAVRGTRRGRRARVDASMPAPTALRRGAAPGREPCAAKKGRAAPWAPVNGGRLWRAPGAGARPAALNPGEDRKPMRGADAACARAGSAMPWQAASSKGQAGRRAACRRTARGAAPAVPRPRSWPGPRTVGPSRRSGGKCRFLGTGGLGGNLQGAGTGVESPPLKEQAASPGRRGRQAALPYP